MPDHVYVIKLIALITCNDDSLKKMVWIGVCVGDGVIIVHLIKTFIKISSKTLNENVKCCLRNKLSYLILS